jgi:KUP system potassium uptake protein
VPGTAVFLSANASGAPAALLANLQYNGVVHDQVLLTTIAIAGVPHISNKERIKVESLGHGMHRVTIAYGFMEELNVPRALASINGEELHFDAEHMPYFVNRTRVIATELPGMARWREELYTLMRRNAASAVDFFHLPPSRVFEIGTSVEM